MRTAIASSVLALVLEAVWAQQEEKKQDEELQKKVAKLVEQLGAEKFEERESATAELKKIGKAATAALKKASESEDAEVRARAKSILESFAKKDETPVKPPKVIRPGMRGSSVVVQSTNGNSVYTLSPSDGDPITFTKNADGTVKLDYKDDKGESAKTESESLDKFLKDHKDLAEKFGITKDGVSYGGSRVSFSGRTIPGMRFRFGNDDDDQDEDPFQDLEKRMEEMRKRFGTGKWDEEDLFPSYASAHGATVERASDLLRAHLDIPADAGLAVRRVKEDSLAEKVGLKKHDIVIEVDGKKIASARDLKDALKLESKVTGLRQGKKQELKREK